MAGAISAGAYTAGVMDYLLETLEKWETAKQENKRIGEGNKGYDPAIPMHEVVIEVISGASAGGITAALSAVALRGDIPHLTEQVREREDVGKKNVFFNTWVNMGEKDILDKLLDTSDLEDGNQPLSILNSNFILELANQAICLDDKPKQPPDRPYISKDLDLFVTICNIEGARYCIRFQNEERHEMCLHSDLVHFVLKDTEQDPYSRIPLDLESNKNIELLKASAIATGAFPLAFAPKKIKKREIPIKDNPLLDYPESEALVLCSKCQKRQDSGRQGLFKVEEEKIQHCVDGGLINNEPFAITRKIIKKKIMLAKMKEKREAGLMKGFSKLFEPQTEDDHHAVIMIDPFPGKKVECDEEGRRPLNLLKIAQLLLEAMIGQIRFKLDGVKDAVTSDQYNVFMIAPRSEKRRKRPLASDVLGGFGGFFDRDFRKKDFFLGRKNCQSFLRKYFAIPQKEYERLFDIKPKENMITRFQCKQLTKEKGYLDDVYLPLIPDMDLFSVIGKDHSEIPEENFTKYDSAGLGKYAKKIRKRSRKLFFALLRSIMSSSDRPKKRRTAVQRLRKILCRILIAILLMVLIIPILIFYYPLMICASHWGIDKIREGIHAGEREDKS